MDNQIITNRLAKLRSKMDAHDIAAILFTHPPNIFYLSGFSGSSAFLCITERAAHLYTDFRYLQQAAEESPLFEIIKVGNSDDFGKIITFLHKSGIKNLAVEEASLTLQRYNKLQAVAQGIELIAQSNFVEEIRAIKEKGEVEKIASAARIADQAFLQLLPLIRPGMREDEIALELEYRLRKAGSQKNPFDIIVASGPRSALPHGLPTGKVIAEGWWDPYRPDLIHTMYSASKSFTSTAVGFAVKEKKLSIEDQVISFFPDKLPDSISPNLEQLKVKHLLMMSTGQRREPPTTTQDWVKSYLETPVDFEPGSRYRYSSLATFMLSAIVQKVSGEKVIDFLTPRLFEPLGIEGSGIKWPNDILINKKKVCGILTELSAEAEKIEWVVIGIGLNANHDPDDFQSDIRDTATSLKINSKEHKIFDRSEIAANIINELEAVYIEFLEKGSGWVAGEWRKWNVTLGKRVKLISQTGIKEAEALDITPDGKLIVRYDDGKTDEVLSGEVTLR